MAKLRIGIVGSGAIGTSLAKFIYKELSDKAVLAALYDVERIKAERLSIFLAHRSSLAVESLERLIAKSDLVIECASAASSFSIAQPCLLKGKDVMIMSVGGVVEKFKVLCDLAKRKNTNIYIPSGAISGIDALKASSIGKIKSVTLTTTKNPLSFKGVKYVEEGGIALDKLKSDLILFSGAAFEAVKYFPQNINVSAVLSLAGIGAHKTKVRIIASPRTKKNIHEIRIESEAGSVFTRTENILHPQNPKTSFLAVLSAIATLKQILEPVKIGT